MANENAGKLELSQLAGQPAERQKRKVEYAGPVYMRDGKRLPLTAANDSRLTGNARKRERLQRKNMTKAIRGNAKRIFGRSLTPEEVRQIREAVSIV